MWAARHPCFFWFVQGHTMIATSKYLGDHRNLGNSFPQYFMDFLSGFWTFLNCSLKRTSSLLRLQNGMGPKFYRGPSRTSLPNHVRPRLTLLLIHHVLCTTRGCRGENDVSFRELFTPFSCTCSNAAGKKVPGVQRVQSAAQVLPSGNLT